MAELFPGALLIVALIGVSVASLVFRSAPERWDNRTFGTLGVVDALGTAIRASFLLDGLSLSSPIPLHWDMLDGMLLSYLSVEFAYSYPRGRRLPVNRRALLLAAVLAAATLSLLPATRTMFWEFGCAAYFGAICVVTAWCFGANYWRLGSDRRPGPMLIIAAVVMRWVSALLTYNVAGRMNQAAFEFMLAFDASVMSFACYALATYAILRHQLFRVRALLADVATTALCLSAIVLSIWAGIELILSRHLGPWETRLLLIALVALPFGLRRAYGPLRNFLETRLVRPLDPRRARTRSALARVVETEGPLELGELFGAAFASLAEVSGGGVVFLIGPSWPPSPGAVEALGGGGSAAPFSALSAPLAAHLGRMPYAHIHRPNATGLDPGVVAELDALPGDLVVPVRRGGALFGALVLGGADLDRDTVETAIALADHLALKLENYVLLARTLGLEAQLEESRRLAALGQFAAAIAHDIRTPLTSVQMNVQILRSKAQLPGDDMEYFDIALSELKRLGAHVTELLDYAKPVRLVRAPVDLREVIEDAVRGLEPILVERNIPLAREHERDLPPVAVDATRIRQALVNLIENAVHASADGSGIVVRTRRIEGQVALEVTDRGHGIDGRDLPKIFEPFFTTRTEGTGLGLAIAQKLVKAHGGEIRVRSLPGEGSTFTVLLSGSAVG